MIPILIYILALLLAISIEEVLKFYSRKLEQKITYKGMVFDGDAKSLLLHLSNKENVEIKEIKEHDNSAYFHEERTIFLSKDIIESSFIHALFCALHEFGHAIHSKIHFERKINTFLFYSFLGSSLLSFLIAYFMIVSNKSMLLFIVMLITVLRLIKSMINLFYEYYANKFAVGLLKKYFGHLTREECFYFNSCKNLALGTYINSLIVWSLLLALLFVIYM